jgi:hypothetical protein
MANLLVKSQADIWAIVIESNHQLYPFEPILDTGLRQGLGVRKALRQPFVGQPFALVEESR